MLKEIDMKLPNKRVEELTQRIISKLLINQNFMKFTDLVNEQEWATFESEMRKSILKGFRDYNSLYDQVTIQIALGRDIDNVEISSKDLPDLYIKTNSFEEALRLVPDLIEKARG